MIVVVDADLDQPTMMRIPEFVARIRGGYDVVIGERTRWRYDNLGRFALSIALFLAQRLLIFQSARFFDTQCGLKAYRQAGGAEAGRSLQTVDGGMYDIEYLYIAVLNRMRIDSVPVMPWPETRATRLRILRCLRTDPVDLLRTSGTASEDGTRRESVGSTSPLATALAVLIWLLYRKVTRLWWTYDDAYTLHVVTTHIFRDFFVSRGRLAAEALHAAGEGRVQADSWGWFGLNTVRWFTLHLAIASAAAVSVYAAAR